MDLKLKKKETNIFKAFTKSQNLISMSLIVLSYLNNLK